MRCYAGSLGNCAGKLSREHFVSRSALEIVGEEVQVSGFPWQPERQLLRIGIDAVASKVLCRGHNAALSVLDQSGREFLQAIKTIFNEATDNDYFVEEVFQLDGNKIELWLLKILCGILASQNRKVPFAWVEILFGRKALPDSAGVHLFGEEGRESTWFFNLVRVHSVNDQSGKIAGAKYGIGGLTFVLAFGKPIFSESTMRSYYRPEGIVFEKGSTQKAMEFAWDPPQGRGSVRIQISGIVKYGEPIPRPLVEPYR